MVEPQKQSGPLALGSTERGVLALPKWKNGGGLRGSTRGVETHLLGKWKRRPLGAAVLLDQALILGLLVVRPWVVRRVKVAAIS
jgi:hypothetical protein